MSIYLLQHQVTGKAINEFKQAETAWKAGKAGESIARLENVLKLDPGYMEAHNNLGARSFEPRHLPARRHEGSRYGPRGRNARAQGAATRSLRSERALRTGHCALLFAGNRR